MFELAWMYERHVKLDVLIFKFLGSRKICHKMNININDYTFFTGMPAVLTLLVMPDFY